MKSPSAERASTREEHVRGATGVRAGRGLAVAGVLCSVMTLCPACRVVSPGPVDSAPTAILKTVGDALIGCRVESVEEYPGERLYDYMNGAAVTYLERHFRTMAACDVFRASEQAKIELYEMASAQDAQELYTELAGSGEAGLGAGQAGCYWAGFEPEGIFHRSRFFVRVLAYAKDVNAGKKLIADVAKGLDAQLQADAH